MLRLFSLSLLLTTTLSLLSAVKERPYLLHDAINIQSIDKVNSLLKVTVDLSLQDSAAQTSLDRAYQSGNPEIVELIFKAGSGLNISKETKEVIRVADNKANLACITLAHLRWLEKKAVEDSIQFKNSIGNPLFGDSYGNISTLLIQLWQGGDFGKDARIVAKRPQGYQCSPEGFKAAVKSDHSDLYLTKKLLHFEKQGHLRKEFLQKSS